MQIVFFTHPAFMPSQSMPRFAQMLQQACIAQGHAVSAWAPKAWLHRWLAHTRLAKWAGYVDQYVIFPWWVRWQLRQVSPDTLFVFCDQALGPWVPLVRHRPHVVHAHDLLALRSALGQIPENPTGWSGRLYQRYIRRGFRQAHQFIAISGRTRDDLHQHAGIDPARITVIHNSLNQPFAPMPPAEVAWHLAQAGLPAAGEFLLHVGGGQWYKNTLGVLRLYAHHAAAQARAGQPVAALVMVSPPPGAQAQALIASLPAGARVQFCQGVSPQALQAAYTGCQLMLFPSLAEGFGWPIVEAQACGAMVLTTDEAPMNEIGGPHSLYLPRLRADQDAQAWALEGARALQAWLSAPAEVLAARKAQGLAWSAQFARERVLGRYLDEYARIWQGHQAPFGTLEEAPVPPNGSQQSAP
jgi:glycosyltransferase involved in cell wall biosynthesis